MNLFLSHSTRDKSEVRKLAVELRSEGVDVWLDEWQIRVGDHITQAIQHGIVNSDYLAIWLTAHAVQSAWVEREWMAKYHSEITEGRIQVLPLLATDCDIPPLLRDKKYADFRQNFDDGLRDLLATLFPHRENYVRATSNIKQNTADLWGQLRWLPTNKASELSCEIRDATFRKVAADLSCLSDHGGFFQFFRDWAYVGDDGQDVYQLDLFNIRPEFVDIVASVARQTPNAQNIAQLMKD